MPKHHTSSKSALGLHPDADRGDDLAEDYLNVITEAEISDFLGQEIKLSPETAAAVPRIQAAILRAVKKQGGRDIMR